MLMLAGCVQPAMMPNINAATARVLDAAGIQTVLAPKAGCCAPRWWGSRRRGKPKLPSLYGRGHRGGCRGASAPHGNLENVGVKESHRAPVRETPSPPPPRKGEGLRDLRRLAQLRELLPHPLPLQPPQMVV